MSSGVRLCSGPALERLLDLRRARYLQPYLGQTATISAAAAELGVSVARMSYQTARLVDVGLIERVALIPRAGRAIAHYRSVADEFIVALADIADGDLEGFLLASEEPLRRALLRSIALAYGDTKVPADRLALRLRRTVSADVEISPCTIDGAEVRWRTATLNAWHVVTLDAADAASLRNDLERLLSQYATSRIGTQHLVRIAMAPIPEA